MKQDDPQFKLRLPPAVKERLEDAAKENGRTLGAEIISRLDGYEEARKDLDRAAQLVHNLASTVHLLTRNKLQPGTPGLLELVESIEADPVHFIQTMQLPDQKSPDSVPGPKAKAPAKKR